MGSSPDRFVRTANGGSSGGGGVVTQGTSPWIVDDPDTQTALGTILAELALILTELQGVLDVNVTGTTGLTEAQLRTVVPDEEGTWSYVAGTSGTEIIPAGGRVIGIAAAATSAGATVTINGGTPIPIPWLTGVVSAADLSPRANLVAPTIVFSGTASYMVEILT